MCSMCEGRKDLRLLAASMTVISAIDFERARMVLMSQKISIEHVREILEEKYPDAPGGELDLRDMLSNEDVDTDAFIAAMGMMAAAQECMAKIDSIYRQYGPFLVPHSVEHEGADAFNGFIQGMFGDADPDGGVHGEDE